MAISEEQKEEIRAKVDIADLVSSYGFQLKHSGSDLWCCCPFHAEKTPSFKVDVSRGTFHCFGCGESGDVFEFVMKQEGLSFGDAVRKLADAAGVELKATVSPMAKRRKRLYALMAELSADFNKMLKSLKCKDAEPAREYLKARQLDETTIDSFQIGYAPSDVKKILAWAARHGYTERDLADAGIIKTSDNPSRQPYFYFANRLVFSIKDKNGQVVAFSGRQLVEDKKSGKYINSPETLIFKKSRNFFAFDVARKNIVKATNREAIICEGQIDCIRLHINGFNTAIAPLGTAFTEDHAIMLHRVADSALLCFDDDGAGHKATIKTAQILLAEQMPIRVLALPDGDDPDSFILKHGKEGFAELIATKTESIVQFQIRAATILEKNPDDTNAAIRITKAVLETISKCRDKIQRSLLLKEAANRLGVEYTTLVGEMVQTVKADEKEQKETSEQLIESIVVDNAADANTSPSILEGALINYILLKRDDISVRDCIKKLIPPDILIAPLAKTIVKGLLSAEKEDCAEALRLAVEGLPTEEYRFFISNMAAFDSSIFQDVSDKNKCLYFARQLWHEYLIRLLCETNANPSIRKIVVDAIRTLHKATMKGVVHLIQSFPLKNFAKGQ